MSRQSEEILLQVPHVRHKKNDGTLYLMAERCGWMMRSKDSFSVVHKYTDIKTQKISPEGKAKVQLQIVLHDDTSTTFHFAHPDGQAAQIRERDGVKETLLQVLPKFKKKVNKELEERHRLLSENPGLLQLYKDLVITQILTPEEFWSQHASSAKSKSKQLSQKQAVGVSGAFLSDIKPQADGANGLKYNLTQDIIESIFKTYPAVKRKHLDNVPYKMTEQEFWTKFFQSHYFHRDRVHGHGVKDLFTECAKDDDKAIKEQLKAGVSDKVANIGGFSDVTIDEHYGGTEGETAKTPANIVHQNIIKRFNQHSIMVMRATEGSTASTTTSTSNQQQLNKASENNSKGQGESATSAFMSAPVIQDDSETSTGFDISRKRLREKLKYEDLEDEDDVDSPSSAKKKADSSKGSSSSFNLTEVERYLNGPTMAGSPEYLTYDEIAASRVSLRHELAGWDHGSKSHEVLSSSSAIAALIDLSPGGSLMQSSRGDALAEQCPESVQQELRVLYTSLGELARHFWACFPPTSPQLEEKAAKMYETMKKFQQLKLRPFENELARNYTAMSSQLTAHINQMLEAAFRKFANWKQKQKKITGGGGGSGVGGSGVSR